MTGWVGRLGQLDSHEGCTCPPELFAPATAISWSPVLLAAQGPREISQDGTSFLSRVLAPCGQVEAGLVSGRVVKQMRIPQMLPSPLPHPRLPFFLL